MSSYRTRLLNVGAIASAIGASICCVGPLLLALTGLGGGALLLRFAPYRPYFLAGTACLLAASFYLTYRSPQENCEPGSICARPASRRTQKIVLWVVTFLVLLVAAFPYYAERLF